MKFIFQNPSSTVQHTSTIKWSALDGLKSLKSGKNAKPRPHVQHISICICMYVCIILSSARAKHAKSARKRARARVKRPRIGNGGLLDGGGFWFLSYCLKKRQS